MIPIEVTQWLENELEETLIDQIPVVGGCINDGQRLITAGGSSFFLKTNNKAPADMFEAEFHGLELLRSGAGPKIPKPILHGKEFLLTEDLNPSKRQFDWAEQLGHDLAQMHARTSSHFGLERNNYIGSNPQKNKFSPDGYAFFAEHRLGYQTRLARDAKLLSRSESLQIDTLSNRLEDFIPPQPPALLHGDLWAGNAISDSQGAPALIDPAVYYGWPEADLAMTDMFGGFGKSFYRAYQEKHHLEPGWRERFPLYNLYHLLNHLNLFGPSYHGQVNSVIRQYS